MKAIVPTLAILLLFGRNAVATCGCQATQMPCEEETLASATQEAALPVTSMDMSLVADGSSSGAWSAFLWSLILAPLIFIVRLVGREQWALLDLHQVPWPEERAPVLARAA